MGSNKSKCALGEISHKDIKKEFKETLIPCPLLAKKGAMASFGSICTVCCVRINSLLEKLGQPASLIDEQGNLLPNDLIADKIKEHKENIVKELTPPLKQYYEAVPKISGKSWEDVARECGMCEVNHDKGTYGWNTTIVPEGEAKLMTPIKT